MFLVGFAYWSILAGTTLAIVVEVYDVFAGRFSDTVHFHLRRT